MNIRNRLSTAPRHSFCILHSAFCILLLSVTAVAANAPSPKAQADALVKEAQTAIKENRLDDACAAFEKAFAVPDLPKENLRGLRERAVKALEKKAPETARRLSEELLADPETDAQMRYRIHLSLASMAKDAKDEKSLYKEAMAAAKVPGGFDRRQAYYLLADYERGKGTLSRHEEPEHIRKYEEIMEQAYQAGVKEMGLPPEAAADTYLKMALYWLWHGGRPGVNSAKAREAFEKAVAAGATAKTGREHGSFKNVKHRLEEREAHEVLFRKFPNRDWRNGDGKFFAEMEKALDAGKKVHAKDFGWNKDDATEALQKAVDSDASVIIVDKMESPWEIEGVRIPSCKKLLLRKGAVIEAKKGGLVKAHAFLALSGTNIVIVGEGGNEIRMRKNDYMTDKEVYPKGGDTRHGLASAGKGPKGNVLVRNLKVASSGGDGFCIAGMKRVWLDKVEFHDHLRQGVTLGTGAETIYLTGCKFNNTWGAEPMSGIDVENWTENCAICEIYCEDCEFADNRNYGLVLATSTWHSPITMFFRNCEFRNNMLNSISILNRPGVPTQNKEIFENCRFLQSAGTCPIAYVRTLIGNVHFKDCLIQEVPGKGVPFVTRSPITVGLAKDMSDYFVGSNVFENVKIVGYEGAPLLSFSSPTEYIKDGAFTGVVDFNGEKIDIAQYVRDMGYDKPAPEFKPVPLDVTKLSPPPLDGAVDAYLMPPFSGKLELIYWARAGRRIKLGFYTRVTGWTWSHKNRNITVVKPDGATEVVAPLDPTNDFTTAFYTIPSEGFYRFRAADRGFWVPADDKVWGYSYHAVTDDFATFAKNIRFTGYFEVPDGVKEITLQTGDCAEFMMADANGKLMAKSGPAGFRTWTCKVEAPGIWCFRILNGSIRFFPPLNGVFADCPENLPRMAR